MVAFTPAVARAAFRQAADWQTVLLGRVENHKRMPVIKIKVRPNSRTSELQEQEDGTFIACLKAPPVDGKANAELVGLVARRFGVSKSAVNIKVGAGARLKLVSIANE